MLKVALKNLLTHKLRMALTGFAIVLGVSFVSGTYIFTDSISGTFDNLFNDVYSKIDVSVRPNDDSSSVNEKGFDENILEIIASTDGVETAQPVVTGFAQLLDKQGELVGGQGPPSLGFSQGADEGLNALRIDPKDGRGPEVAGEVAIDKTTAEKNSFVVGDRVKIITEGPVEEFEIVGIATFGDAESLAGATISIFEFKEAQRLFGLEGKLSVVDIRKEDGFNNEELIANLENSLGDDLEVVTGQQQADEELNDINRELGFINTALLVFAGIAIFVGSFIIQNTFRIIVSQRIKELALLRAIGASKKQVLSLVVYEAIAIGFVASVIGIVAGVGISQAVRGLMNAVGLALPSGPLTLETRTIVVSMLVGVVVTTLASLLPALAASRLSPVEALSDNPASTKRKTLLRRGIIGMLMIAVGGLMIVYALGSGGLSNPVYYVGFGAFLQFVGVSVMAPLLAAPVARTIGWLLAKFKGATARLAYRNAARTPRRTASTAAALMIGVSLIAFVSILASSFKGAIDQIITESFAADITITSNNSGEAGPGSAGFSPEVTQRLESISEIGEVTQIRYAFNDFEVIGDEGTFVLAGIDDNLDQLLKLGPTENAYESLDSESIVVSESSLSNLKASIGDKVTIEYAGNNQKEYTVVGSFSEPFDSDYLISNEEYLSRFSNERVTFVAAKYASGVDAESAKIAAEEAVADFPQVEVLDTEDLAETARTQIDQILGLLWGLLAMAVIIAIFGITNTLMLSISERTREIGLTRAIGMTRKQLRSMIRYESVIIAMFGALLGLAMGMFFAWAVVNALEGEGIEKIVISYTQLVVYLVLSVVAGVIAAAWPARKAAKMDVLKAISHE